MGIVDEVSAELWDPYLEMPAVLGVELNIPVVTEESNLAVVV